VGTAVNLDAQILRPIKQIIAVSVDVYATLLQSVNCSLYFLITDVETDVIQTSLWNARPEVKHQKARIGQFWIWRAHALPVAVAERLQPKHLPQETFHAGRR
jgi:hypothetical protein